VSHRELRRIIRWGAQIQMGGVSSRGRGWESGGEAPWSWNTWLLDV